LFQVAYYPRPSSLFIVEIGEYKKMNTREHAKRRSLRLTSLSVDQGLKTHLSYRRYGHMRYMLQVSTVRSIQLLIIFAGRESDCIQLNNVSHSWHFDAVLHAGNSLGSIINSMKNLHSWSGFEKKLAYILWESVMFTVITLRVNR
jgi:hypothetical protein